MAKNGRENGKRLKLPPLWSSLSARLLVMTVLFVMLAEVFIFAPSIGLFRINHFEERLAAAHIAVLSLKSTPDYMVGEELEAELLRHVGAYVIGLHEPGGRALMLGMVDGAPEIDMDVDLRDRQFFSLIGEAFATLGAFTNRTLRVVGPSPKDPDALVEIVIDEWPLRTGMIDYARRILALSIVISLVTATLVYLTLQWWMVRPIRRITEDMVAFRRDPEDLSHALRVEGRRDEIGLAQREMADLQTGLRSALRQKTRLAALGTAVTKISHDLRNILATARLVSDRLADSDDPQVKRSTPTLLAAIDRAVDLCQRTLDFTHEGLPSLQLSRFALRPLLSEVIGGLPIAGSDGAPPQIEENLGDLALEADRDQLYRLFANLIGNAAHAGASKMTISAARMGRFVCIEIADNGPGLPPKARENLFRPFAGSARPGGSGLGLAIARELARAHGGDLILLRSTGAGTAFRLDLPAERAA